MVCLHPLPSHLHPTPPHKDPGPLSLTLLICNPRNFFFLFLFLMILFIYLFIYGCVGSLRLCRLSLLVASGVYSLVVGRRLLIAVVSLSRAQALRYAGFSSCSSRI